MVDFIRLAILRHAPISHENIANVLIEASSFSAIDLYEALFTTAAQQTRQLHNPPIMEIFSELRMCNEIIGDERLDKLIAYVDSTKQRHISWSKEPFFQKLLSPRLSQSESVVNVEPEAGLILTFQRAMLANRDDVTASILNSATSWPKTSIIRQALYHLGSMLDDSQTTDHRRQFMRLAINSTSRSYGPLLLASVSDLTASTPTDLQSFLLMDFVLGHSVSARHFGVLANNNNYNRLFDHTFADNAFVQAEAYASGVANEPPDTIDPMFLRALTLQRGIALSDARATLKASQAGSAAASGMAKAHFTRALANSLLDLDRLSEALSVIVAAILQGDDGHYVLPITALVRRIDKTFRRNHAANIDVVILFDFYTRLISADLSNVRRYAFNDFLKAAGNLRPSSQALDKLVDPKRLIYFSRNICVSDVMQMHRPLRNTADVEDERLAVLHRLKVLDSTNQDQYDTEIQDILLRQAISGAIRHIEQSKIEIDQPAVRRWAADNIKEHFRRYTALRRAKLATYDDALEDVLRELFRERTISQDKLFFVPTDEAFALLMSMLDMLITTCISDPERGLDSYLSLRVRHGTLSGELRSASETQNIITQRAVAKTEYESNFLWRERLTNIPTWIVDQIDVALAQFSANYDRYIDRITNDLVQIRSTRKPDGFFSIDDTSRLLIARIIAQESADYATLDAFIDHFFVLFWQGMEPSLSQARRAFETSLRQDLNELFDNLSTTITQIGQGHLVGDLDRAVKMAHTNSLTSLDRVRDWFNASARSGEPNLSLRQLIGVGFEMGARYHPDFKPRISNSVESTSILRGAVRPFSDLFFNIFENIFRHCGLKSPEVIISGSDDGCRVSVIIANEVLPEKATSSAKQRVSRIQAQIESGDYQGVIVQEGGSGFVKMHRIVKGEPELNGDLSFRFESDRRFEVTLSLDWPLRG